MKIAFFTEGGYKEVDRKLPMRTDQSWVCALKAHHHPIPLLEETMFEFDDKSYDVGVVIIPKTTGGNTGASKNSFDREGLTNQNYPLIKNITFYKVQILIQYKK